MPNHTNEQPSQSQDQRHTSALDETLEFSESLKRRLWSPASV